MKNYLKVASLIVAFFVTFFIVLSRESQGDAKIITNISEATLPVIYAVSDNGLIYNQMHGYKCDIDAYKACEYITVLPLDRHLSIRIDKYNSSISGLSYEVRSKDGSNLYEDTVVKNYEDSGAYINAVLYIKNLLDENVDYILKIKVALTNGTEVDFYTYIKYSADADVDKKLDFVKWFSDKTYDRSNLSEIKKYIETKSDADNTNYGYVNIYSSLSMFGYGDLDIERENEGNIYIRQIDGIDAYIYNEFMASTKDNDGKKIYYKVKECYTLSEGKTGIYLMGYERFMNQIFDMSNAIMPSSRVYFGISRDDALEFMEDEKGRKTAFVRDGSLYLYDIKDNILNGIFSFDDNEGDHVRERYEKHNIKIANVDKSGDVTFAIYGYMNRGKHEGVMGVSLCKYDAASNDVNEIAFIPVKSDYDTLCASFGDIIYVNNNNTATYRIGDVLYSLDTNSGEVTIIIEGLSKGDYSVSEDGMIVSYNKDGEIHQYNLSTEKENVIPKFEGGMLKNIGYINSDYIYGEILNQDITNMRIGNTIYPMRKIYIRDKENNIIKEYGIENVYVTDYSISGMRINLIRMKKDADGNWVFTDIDQLMNKNDNIKPENAYVKNVATDSRKVELYLQLSNTVSDAKNVKKQYAKEVIFIENDSKMMEIDDSVNVRILEDTKMHYLCNYTYKLSELTTSDEDNSDSLVLSSKLVLSSLGRNDNVADDFLSGKSLLTQLDECNNVQSYNLTGMSLTDALGFVATGKYVIVMTDYNEYMVISGYTKSSVIIFNPKTLKTETVDREKFADKLNKIGNVMVSYY